MQSIQFFCIFYASFVLATVLGQNSFYDDEYIDDTEYQDPYELPKFLATPQQFSVEIGDQITLPCDVDKSDESYPLMFKYISPRRVRDRMIYVGNKALGKNPRIRKEGNSFILSKVRKSDAGNYICRFESKPVVELSHTLNVQYPAMVVRGSEEVQRVTQGSNVTLSCQAKGNPPPAITWSKQEGKLPSGAQSEEGLSILLKQVDRHVEGTYICTASNGIGEPSSTSMTVQVEYGPEITTEQISIMNTENGYTASLVCIIYGRPSPTVQWYRGDSLISSEKHVQKHDGAHRHVLQINRVSEEDFGEYACHAKNKHGEKKMNLVLTGLPKAPKITSGPAGGEKVKYTLTWKTETFAPITQYRIKYRRRYNPYEKIPAGSWKDDLFAPTSRASTNREQRLSHGSVLTMKHLVKDLEPAKDYEVKVRLENKFGWSPFSRTFHFHTKREMAVGRAMSGAASDSITVNLSLFVLCLILNL